MSGFEEPARVGKALATSAGQTRIGLNEATSTMVIAGLAAILYAVMPAVSLPFTGESGLVISSDPGTITEFFEGLTFDGNYLIGGTMLIISSMAFLVFVAMTISISRADASYRSLGYLVIAGAVVFTVLGFGYSAALGTGAFWNSNGGLPSESYLLLYGLMMGFVFLGAAGLVLVNIPLGYVIVRTGVLPRWLGWFTIGVGVVYLTGPLLPVLPDQAFFVFGGVQSLWPLITGIVLLFESRRLAHA